MKNIESLNGQSEEKAMLDADAVGLEPHQLQNVMTAFGNVDWRNLPQQPCTTFFLEKHSVPFAAFEREKIRLNDSRGITKAEEEVKIADKTKELDRNLAQADRLAGGASLMQVSPSSTGQMHDIHGGHITKDTASHKVYTGGRGSSSLYKGQHPALYQLQLTGTTGSVAVTITGPIGSTSKHVTTTPPRGDNQSPVEGSVFLDVDVGVVSSVTVEPVEDATSHWEGGVVRVSKLGVTSMFPVAGEVKKKVMVLLNKASFNVTVTVGEDDRSGSDGQIYADIVGSTGLRTGLQPLVRGARKGTTVSAEINAKDVGDVVAVDLTVASSDSMEIEQIEIVKNAGPIKAYVPVKQYISGFLPCAAGCHDTSKGQSSCKSVTLQGRYSTSGCLAECNTSEECVAATVTYVDTKYGGKCTLHDCDVAQAKRVLLDAKSKLYLKKEQKQTFEVKVSEVSDVGMFKRASIEAVQGVYKTLTATSPEACAKSCLNDVTPAGLQRTVNGCTCNVEAGEMCKPRQDHKWGWCATQPMPLFMPSSTVSFAVGPAACGDTIKGIKCSGSKSFNSDFLVMAAGDGSIALKGKFSDRFCGVGSNGIVVCDQASVGVSASYVASHMKGFTTLKSSHTGKYCGVSQGVFKCSFSSQFIPEVQIKVTCVSGTCTAGNGCGTTDKRGSWDYCTPPPGHNGYCHAFSFSNGKCNLGRSYATTLTTEGARAFAYDHAMSCGCKQVNVCKSVNQCKLQKYTVCQGSKPSLVVPKTFVTGQPLPVDYGFPGDKPNVKIVLAPYTNGGAPPNHANFHTYTKVRPGMIPAGISPSLSAQHGTYTFRKLDLLPAGRYEVSLWGHGGHNGWVWLVAGTTEVLPHEMMSPETDTVPVLIDVKAHSKNSIKVTATDRKTAMFLGITPPGGHVLYKGNGSCKSAALLREHAGANVFIRAPQYCGSRGANTGYWSTCVSVAADETGKLICPRADAIIDHISFASYGLPGGDCNGNLHVTDSCHASVSMPTVSKLCVGRNNCDLTANQKSFDSCPEGSRPFVGRESQLCCINKPDGSDARVAATTERIEYKRYQDYAVEGCSIEGAPASSTTYNSCKVACDGESRCKAFQYKYQSTLVTANKKCSSDSALRENGVLFDKEMQTHSNCQALCAKSSGCTHFTWWAQSGLCTLHTNCEAPTTIDFIPSEPVTRGEEEGISAIYIMSAGTCTLKSCAGAAGDVGTDIFEKTTPPKDTVACACGKATCTEMPTLNKNCPAGVAHRLVVSAVCKQKAEVQTPETNEAKAIMGKLVMKCIRPEEGLQIPAPKGIVSNSVTSPAFSFTMWIFPKDLPSPGDMPVNIMQVGHNPIKSPSLFITDEHHLTVLFSRPSKCPAGSTRYVTKQLEPVCCPNYGDGESGIIPCLSDKNKACGCKRVHVPAVYKGGYIGCLSSYPLQSRIWTHVAISYDGTTLKLYADGALMCSQDAIGIISPAGPIHVSAPGTPVASVRVADLRRQSIALQETDLLEQHMTAKSYKECEPRAEGEVGSTSKSKTGFGKSTVAELGLMLAETGFNDHNHFRRTISKHHSRAFVHSNAEAHQYVKEERGQAKRPRTKKEVLSYLQQAKERGQPRLNAFKQLRALLHEDPKQARFIAEVVLSSSDVTPEAKGVGLSAVMTLGTAEAQRYVVQSMQDAPRPEDREQAIINLGFLEEPNEATIREVRKTAGANIHDLQYSRQIQLILGVYAHKLRKQGKMGQSEDLHKDIMARARRYTKTYDKSPTQDAEDRLEMSLITIENSGDSRALPFVITHLHHDALPIRVAATHALRHMEHPDVNTLLIHMFTHNKGYAVNEKHNPVHRAAINTLAARHMQEHEVREVAGELHRPDGIEQNKRLVKELSKFVEQQKDRANPAVSDLEEAMVQVQVGAAKRKCGDPYKTDPAAAAKASAGLSDVFDRQMEAKAASKTAVATNKQLFTFIITVPKAQINQIMSKLDTALKSTKIGMTLKAKLNAQFMINGIDKVFDPAVTEAKLVTKVTKSKSPTADNGEVMSDAVISKEWAKGVIELTWGGDAFGTDQQDAVKQVIAEIALCSPACKHNDVTLVMPNVIAYSLTSYTKMDTVKARAALIDYFSDAETANPKFIQDMVKKTELDRTLYKDETQLIWQNSKFAVVLNADISGAGVAGNLLITGFDDATLANGMDSIKDVIATAAGKVCGSPGDMIQSHKSEKCLEETAAGDVIAEVACGTSNTVYGQFTYDLATKRIGLKSNYDKNTLTKSTSKCLTKSDGDTVKLSTCLTGNAAKAQQWTLKIYHQPNVMTTRVTRITQGNKCLTQDILEEQSANITTLEKTIAGFAAQIKSFAEANPPIDDSKVRERKKAADADLKLKKASYDESFKAKSKSKRGLIGLVDCMNESDFKNKWLPFKAEIKASALLMQTSTQKPYLGSQFWTMENQNQPLKGYIPCGKGNIAIDDPVQQDSVSTVEETVAAEIAKEDTKAQLNAYMSLFERNKERMASALEYKSTDAAGNTVINWRDFFLSRFTYGDGCDNTDNLQCFPNGMLVRKGTAAEYKNDLVDEEDEDAMKCECVCLAGWTGASCNQCTAPGGDQRFNLLGKKSKMKWKSRCSGVAAACDDGSALSGCWSTGLKTTGIIGSLGKAAAKSAAKSCKKKESKWKTDPGCEAALKASQARSAEEGQMVKCYDFLPKESSGISNRVSNAKTVWNRHQSGCANVFRSVCGNGYASNLAMCRDKLNDRVFQEKEIAMNQCEVDDDHRSTPACTAS